MAHDDGYSRTAKVSDLRSKKGGVARTRRLVATRVGFVGADDRAEIVELRPEGIVPAFSVPSIWGFGRIR